jgi:hypothetical protein
LAVGPQARVRRAVPGPLGLDGRPAGARLPQRAAQGHRAASASPGAPRAAVVPNAPSSLSSSFDASRESNSGLIPSDSNAAVGFSHIVEVVNAQLSVFSKTGAVLCPARSLAPAAGRWHAPWAASTATPAADPPGAHPPTPPCNASPPQSTDPANRHSVRQPA